MTKWKDFFYSGSGFAIALMMALLVLIGAVFYLVTLGIASAGGRYVDFATGIQWAIGTILPVLGVNFLLRSKLWKEAMDHAGKRLGVAEAAVKAGLVDYWPLAEVPWSSLYKKAKCVTIIAVAGRADFIERHSLVQDLLSRKGTRLTIVLCDPDAEAALNALDADHDEAAGTRRTKILETLRELQKLTRYMTGKRPKLELHLIAQRLTYATYFFDAQTLYIPYGIKPERAKERVPAILVKNGHMLDAFLRRDKDFALTKPKLSPEDLCRIAKS